MATKSIVESLKQLRDDLKTWTTNNLAKRQKTITGAATTITDSNLTASRALVSNSSGKVAVSDVTATELSYLDGVTSNVQTQLNAKAASSSLSNYLLKSSVGAASGAASLDSSGKVPSSQLPSYVDDVLEYTSKSNFPTSGESGKIYVATDTNLTYRWTGSAYVEISQSIALGETSSTAYRGDRGAAAYTHSQTTSGTVHGINTDYLKNVTSDVQTQLDAKAASSHTHSAATTSAAGFMSASDKSKLDGITASADSVAFTQSVTSGTKIGTITINGIATGLWAPANVDTHYISSTVVGSSATALANTTSALTNGNVYLNHIENGTVRNSHKISGSGNTTVTSDASGNIIVSSTGSSYGVATSSTLGLVKSGTDITVDSSGNVSVNDDSHNHVISNIDGLQSSLDAKQATITGGASTITSSNLTASRALISNSSGKVAVSDVTSTELGYLDGVTSNVQTQLNAKYQIYTQSIIVEGDADTYYPVAIPLSSDKSKVNHISIWKNLGSTTPSSYSGNHITGTSSLWLLYEGRSMTWDSNGGFIKTIYKSQPFATLVAHTSNVGNGSSYLFVWLRGGTCQYNISTDYSTTSKIYYESTNLGESNYPINIAPITAINNGGIYTSSPYVAYGNIQGNATTATTATTAAKATADADGNTISSTYRKLSDNNFSTALTLSTDDVTSINFGNYGYIDYEVADKKLEIGSNYGRPDNEHRLYSNINFGDGNATLYADNNINVNATNSITLSADTIYIGQLCSSLLGLSYGDVYIGDQLKALGGLTTAEIGYLDGVTSSIQTQLNNKLSLSGGTVTGTLVLSKITDLSGTANNSPALIVGGTATSAHLELDNNEITAKSDGTTPASLYLNADGGRVYLGNPGGYSQAVCVNDGFLTVPVITGPYSIEFSTGNGAAIKVDYYDSSDLCIGCLDAENFLEFTSTYNRFYGPVHLSDLSIDYNGYLRINGAGFTVYDTYDDSDWLTVSNGGTQISFCGDDMNISNVSSITTPSGAAYLTSIDSTVTFKRVIMTYSTRATAATTINGYIHLYLTLRPKDSVNTSSVAEFNKSIWSIYPNDSSYGSVGLQIPGVYVTTSGSVYPGVYSLTSSSGTGYFKYNGTGSIACSAIGVSTGSGIAVITYSNGN